MDDRILTREEFIEVMGDLARLSHNNLLLNKTLEEIGADGYLFIPNGTETILNILHRMFKDENDWIDYYFVDMDFGANYSPGSITDGDGNDIPLRNAGDLYDLLMKEFQEGTD